MIPAALFTAFGPVTLVKILFRLSHSLWKTKLSSPVTIYEVKYVSASSIALAIAVSTRLAMAELFKIVVSYLLL